MARTYEHTVCNRTFKSPQGLGAHVRNYNRRGYCPIEGTSYASYPRPILEEHEMSLNDVVEILQAKHSRLIRAIEVLTTLNQSEGVRDNG